MEKKTWILLSDSAKAIVYAFYPALLFQKQQDENNLEFICEYEHVASRKKARELVTDKLGGFGSGTFVESTSPKLHEAEEFAHQLIGLLDKARKENLFRDVILVCPPHFMGLLQKHMPHDLHKLISKTIEKDYVQNTKKELLHHLIKFL